MHQIKKDLQKKMVFIGGPRQAGKTTLAQAIAETMNSANGYLNWDFDEDRERILKRELPDAPLWIFDELHKFRSWRNYLKGLFDKTKGSKKIIVTGSARLDFYRYTGDSLQGRYHYLRLHPLSIDELHDELHDELDGEPHQVIQDLFKLGGFPEPFFSGEKFESDRWSREYRSRLLNDDIRSVENIEDLGNAELLLLRLPDLVGSPLSINSLREDLRVSFKTVERWLDIYERFYAIFRIHSFSQPFIKAVKKERKHYHFDWNLIKNPGARFENMVGSHLLKWCNWFEDTQGRDLTLNFFRDTEQREVDFVVCEDRKPLLFVEVKKSDVAISKDLLYLSRKFPNTPAFQIYLEGQKAFQSQEGVRVGPAAVLLFEIRSLIEKGPPS